MRIAEAGIEELQKFVDTLIIIPNQNLFRVANERTTFADAFKMADDVLHSGVRGVTDLMVMPGLINLDFADIRTVMSEMGKAMMGTGEAEGERRAIDAAEAAISNPLLEDVSMKGARGVLINITGGLDMTLFEVDEAANRIREEVDPDANIIFGSTFDEKLQGKMRISVVATGIEAEGGPQGERTPALAARLPGADSGAGMRSPSAGGYTQPILTQNAGIPPIQRSEARPDLAVDPAPPAAEAAESAAVRSGAFMAPKPIDPGTPRQVPLAHPAVPPAAVRCARARPGAEPYRARHRRRPRAPHRPAPPPLTAPRPAVPTMPHGARRSSDATHAGAGAAPGPTPAHPARARGAHRQQQGRRSARHPRLPAPPSELSRQESRVDRPAECVSGILGARLQRSCR